MAGLTKIKAGAFHPGCVDATALATGSITNADILDDAITTTKILDNQITTAKLGTNSVTAAEILNGEVTSAKLAANLAFSGTEGVVIPSGTTAQRNGSPTNGTFRYNTDDNVFEGRINGAWGPVGGGASGGGSDAVFYENDQTVTTNYSIASNQNAMSAGNITINNGITVTLEHTGAGGNGARWVIV